MAGGQVVADKVHTLNCIDPSLSAIKVSKKTYQTIKISNISTWNFGYQNR